MRRSLVVTAAGAAGVIACTLTTSFDGLTGGALVDAGPSTADTGGKGSVGDVELPDVAAGGSDAGDSGASSSSAYRTRIVGDGPVAYYRLGDTGGTAKDEMGAHDGIYMGTFTHGPGAIAGDPDEALVTSGQGWVDLAQVFPFKGVALYSIEAWVAPSSAPTLTGVLARNLAPDGSPPSDGYSLYIDAPNLAPTMGRWLSNVEESAAGPGLLAETFAHVVGTYDGSTLRVYVNGALVSSGSSTQSIIAPAADVTIAATRNGTYGLFIGSLDEVALYDKALPPESVAAHYKAGRGM